MIYKADESSRTSRLGVLRDRRAKVRFRARTSGSEAAIRNLPELTVSCRW